MTSPWGPIIAALIAAVAAVVIAVIEHRRRKATDVLLVAATNRANNLDQQRLEIERHRKDIEGERNSLAIKNEFNRRFEVAQLKALSEDTKQRKAGLIDLESLRDEAPSPERAKVVQAHIDAIKNAVVGQMMVNGMDFFNEALKKMPYLQAPSEPPSSTPEGHRIWEIAKQTAENNEELKDLLRKENGRHRDIGQSLIDGEDSTAGDAPDKA